jgi:hypothetical protein
LIALNEEMAMKRKSANGLGRLEDRLTREEKIALSLLRILVELVAIKEDLTKTDFHRLPALTPLFEAADQLIIEMGFADED